MVICSASDHLLAVCCGTNYSLLSQASQSFTLLAKGTTDELSSSFREKKSQHQDNVSCCAVSSHYCIFCFSTVNKVLYIMRISQGSLSLLSMIDLDKKAVSLIVTSNSEILVGVKAGLIYRVSISNEETVSEDKSKYCPYVSHYKTNSRLTGIAGTISVLTDCCISLDQSLLAFSDRDMKVKVCKYPDSFEMCAILMGHRDAVCSCCFLDNSSRILSSSLDGTLKLWDVPSKKVASTLDFRESELNSKCYPIHILRIDQHQFIVSTRNRNAVYLINLSEQEMTISDHVMIEHQISNLCLSGNNVIVSSKNGMTPLLMFSILEGRLQSGESLNERFSLGSDFFCDCDKIQYDIDTISPNPYNVKGGEDTNEDLSDEDPPLKASRGDEVAATA